MAKGGGKSSASSGTRKKHARRAAGPAPTEEPLPKEKKLKTKEKGKKKEPRQKVFIPPVKPAPIQPDPLETMGLSRRLPPDLLVVLRSLAKKAPVTKIRALEELQSGWIDKCQKEGEVSLLVYTLVDMLPVWLHHVSALFMHPSRRIRLLTAGIHSSFLQIPAVRDQIFYFFGEAAVTHQIESLLGTWCMAAHDIDRAVATFALKSWDATISISSQEVSKNLVLDDHLLPHLLSFVQRTLLDPNGIYSYLNPTPPVVPPTPPKRVPGRPTPVVSVRKEDTEQNLRSKADELEESDQDRKARLRVGAFGAIKWVLETTGSSSTEDLTNFLANPALWSSLYHAEICPFVDVESFGFSQPNVRKSAWTLVQTLLRNRNCIVEPLHSVLSTGILRSAWVEADTTVHAVMWQPLLTFLKEFPSAWELELAHESSKFERDEDESDSEDETDENTKKEMISASGPLQGHSLAYQEFLQFLELGCSGSPLQGYPTVVIILSTISSTILASSPSSPPLTDFFTSFWAAIDGRALSSLQRGATSAAFLSSLLECMIFLIKRTRNDAGNHAALLLGSPTLDGETMPIDVDGETKKLVSEQFGRVWQELENKGLRAEPGVAATLMSKTLVSLNEIDGGLFHAAWDILAVAIKASSTTAPALVSVVLKVFDDYYEGGTDPKIATRVLIAEILQSSVIQCEKILNTEGTDEPAGTGVVTLLVKMLDTFRESLFHDEEFSTRIDDMTSEKAFLLLSASPSLLLAYLSHRQDEDRCLNLWHALLSGVALHPEAIQVSLSPLLEAAQKGLLPKYLKPKAGELDEQVGKLLADALTGPIATVQLSVVRQLLQTSDHFVSESGFRALFQSLISAFSSQVDHALSDPDIPLFSFETSLHLITTVFEHRSDFVSTEDTIASMLPEVFIFAYLLPRCYSSNDDQSVITAQSLWTLWEKTAQTDMQAKVYWRIKDTLKGLLRDTQVRPTPENILQMVSDAPGLHVDLFGNIFPSRDDIDAMLDDLSPDPIDASLAVTEPLVPPPSAFKGTRFPLQTYDSRGFSSYARVVGALLRVFIEDRQSAKENMWALRHFLALALYTGDFLQIPSAQSPVFEQKALTASLTDLVSKAQQLATYLLTSSSDDGWLLSAIAALIDNKPADGFQALPKFLIDLIRHTASIDTIRECRILRIVLQHVLDVDKAQADLWILFARKIEKTAPQTSIVIVSSITEFAPEPPRLDRYRNELAASLLGIPAAKADTEGLLVLRKLRAAAPDPESDVVFLPQLRAVNVVKACQQWITSDEGADEELESAMISVFFYLAPILQNVPGAHWDLIFDVIESNLENSSFRDNSTLVGLARTLKLIISVQDLASMNKALRADWQARRMPILMLVRDLATAKLDTTGVSVPRSVCRELVLSIVQGLPPSLIDQDTLSKMCHLLTDPSTDVQMIAYHLLQGAAKKRTEYLVIEAGVDAEATVKDGLPKELLDILQQCLAFNQIDEFEQDEQSVFGYVLGWMVVFDLFLDASLKVRSSYIDQLRDLDIVATHFIPTVLHYLQINEGIMKAFKLEIWAVDEYFVQLYEPGTSFSLQILVAHLYYRALLTVPSLIHTWVLDCKDRQLSSTIVNYTAQHFSPVIIRTELAHVKSPEATAELVDENLTIKVATSVNEVTASYLVDEHQLEIKLKIPSDWPLHRIEVKDLKRVGVDENRWRAWILAVQQTIWSHNGRIVDGLNLFKKNVTLHFEGQVECAICYSIISVMDGTLPRKPCKTCKNRFHAGCLYKWFNSSHSSSCPLCRSDIF